MKRTIWIGILLLCIGIGKVRAQNDPVLAGMILLYTDKGHHFQILKRSLFLCCLT